MAIPNCQTQTLVPPYRRRPNRTSCQYLLRKDNRHCLELQ
ncbi:hypothetical protein COOONC_12218 [Cooperia oncophora]